MLSTDLLKLLCRCRILRSENLEHKTKHPYSSSESFRGSRRTVSVAHSLSWSSQEKPKQRPSQFFGGRLSTRSFWPRQIISATRLRARQAFAMTFIAATKRVVSTKIKMARFWASIVLLGQVLRTMWDAHNLTVWSSILQTFGRPTIATGWTQSIFSSSARNAGTRLRVGCDGASQAFCESVRRNSIRPMRQTSTSA